MAATQNLIIRKGSTYQQIVRWETPPIVYKPITGISQAAPAVVTAATHGVPDGWRVAIVSVKGMTQINALNSPPKDKDYHKATVGNANAITLNDVNSSDYKTYTSGGYVQYNTPKDMTGYSARMSIKDKVGGTELLRLDTIGGKIVIDNTAKTITLALTATQTAAITFTKGVYDLEMVSAVGDVTPLMKGSVTIEAEVTTT